MRRIHGKQEAGAAEAAPTSHPLTAGLVAVAALPGAGARGAAGAVGAGAVRVAAFPLGLFGLLLLVVHGVVGLCCSTAQSSDRNVALALHPHREGLYHFALRIGPEMRRYFPTG